MPAIQRVFGRLVRPGEPGDPYDHRHSHTVRNHCLSVTNGPEWTYAAAGAGAAWSLLDASGNALGVARAAMGTVDTNTISLGGALTGIKLGNGAVWRDVRFRHVTLSIALQRYKTKIGLMDLMAASQNGIYFDQVDNVNSGKWRAVVQKAGVEVGADTGVAGDLNWHKFEIDTHQNGTSAVFKIDGTVVARVSGATLPLTTTGLGFGISGERSVGTDPINAFDVDFDVFEQAFATRL